MSIDDNTSDNTPVIKSRTGKFLRGVFDKKNTARSRPRTKSTPNSSQEFMQVVPAPITWDEGEETNWDDDFIEAPQPAFVEPQQPVPPAPPTAFKTAHPAPETIDPIPALNESGSDLLQPSITAPTVDQSTTNSSNPPAPAHKKIAPPAPPRSTGTKTGEANLPATITSGASEAIEVSIPRPKNIKYKSKDPNAEPVSKSSTPKNDVGSAAIDLDIQRPKNIKYKTKLPVKASLPERLLAPLKSLFTKIAAPFESLTAIFGDSFACTFGDRTPKIYIEQVPADGKIPSKKSWQLPSLGSENFRQILVVAGALFFVMTVAWAVINFWPRSNLVAVTPAPPVIQPAAPIKPIVSPEAALVAAVKNRSQTLASLYPTGLIANLELDDKQGLATVTVGDLWFSLTPEQQQQTAQSLWQQARNYQMSGLEVRGTTDRLVARSPFIGTEAILTSQ